MMMFKNIPKRIILSLFSVLFFTRTSMAQVLMDGGVNSTSTAEVGIFSPELTFWVGNLDSSEENNGRLSFSFNLIKK